MIAVSSGLTRWHGQACPHPISAGGKCWKENKSTWFASCFLFLSSLQVLKPCASLLWSHQFALCDPTCWVWGDAGTGTTHLLWGRTFENCYCVMLPFGKRAAHSGLQVDGQESKAQYGRHESSRPLLPCWALFSLCTQLVVILNGCWIEGFLLMQFSFLFNCFGSLTAGKASCPGAPLHFRAKRTLESF